MLSEAKFTENLSYGNDFCKEIAFTAEKICNSFMLVRGEYINPNSSPYIILIFIPYYI